MSVEVAIKEQEEMVKSIKETVMQLSRNLIYGNEKHLELIYCQKGFALTFPEMEEDPLENGITPDCMVDHDLFAVTRSRDSAKGLCGFFELEDNDRMSRIVYDLDYGFAWKETTTGYGYCPHYTMDKRKAAEEAARKAAEEARAKEAQKPQIVIKEVPRELTEHEINILVESRLDYAFYTKLHEALTEERTKVEEDAFNRGVASVKETSGDEIHQKFEDWKKKWTDAENKKHQNALDQMALKHSSEINALKRIIKTQQDTIEEHQRRNNRLSKRVRDLQEKPTNNLDRMFRSIEADDPVNRTRDDYNAYQISMMGIAPSFNIWKNTGNGIEYVRKILQASQKEKEKAGKVRLTLVQIARLCTSNAKQKKNLDIHAFSYLPKQEIKEFLYSVGVINEKEMEGYDCKYKQMTTGTGLERFPSELDHSEYMATATLLYCITTYDRIPELCKMLRRATLCELIKVPNYIDHTHSDNRNRQIYEMWDRIAEAAETIPDLIRMVQEQKAKEAPKRLEGPTAE